MEDFNVGDRVKVTLLGKERKSKILSFVPAIEGGTLATILVGSREYVVSTESLKKVRRKSKKQKQA